MFDFISQFDSFDPCLNTFDEPPLFCVSFDICSPNSKNHFHHQQSIKRFYFSSAIQRLAVLFESPKIGPLPSLPPQSLPLFESMLLKQIVTLTVKQWCVLQLRLPFVPTINLCGPIPVFNRLPYKTTLPIRALIKMHSMNAQLTSSYFIHMDTQMCEEMWCVAAQL